MITGLGTPTECKVDEMNPIGMNDGEGFGAPQGVRALLDGVVTKL